MTPIRGLRRAITPVFFICAAVLTACGSPESAHTGRHWLLRIRGQSNAVGGGTDKARDPVAEVPYREFVAGRNDYSVVLQHDWEPLATRDGGHHGLEFGFAWAALEAGDRVTIEKYAVSGTALYRWEKDGGDIYPRQLAWWSDSEATCPDCEGAIHVMAWWQGEADGNPIQRAQTYGERLATFTEDLRSDVGQPDMPIVAMRLRADSPRLYTAEERTSLERDWRLSRPDVNLVVDLDDLPTKTDNVHYDTQSLDEVGRRVYEAVAR